MFSLFFFLFPFLILVIFFSTLFTTSAIALITNRPSHPIMSNLSNADLATLAAQVPGNGYEILSKTILMQKTANVFNEMVGVTMGAACPIRRKAMVIADQSILFGQYPALFSLFVYFASGRTDVLTRANLEYAFKKDSTQAGMVSLIDPTYAPSSNRTPAVASNAANDATIRQMRAAFDDLQADNDALVEEQIEKDTEINQLREEVQRLRIENARLRNAARRTPTPTSTKTGPVYPAAIDTSEFFHTENEGTMFESTSAQPSALPSPTHSDVSTGVTSHASRRPRLTEAERLKMATAKYLGSSDGQLPARRVTRSTAI